MYKFRESFNAQDLAAEECYCSYETLVVELARVMNEIHNEERSVRYWEHLLGAYILWSLQVVYERYVFVIKGGQYDEKASSFLDVPLDTQHLVKLASESESWNAALLSYIGLLNRGESLPKSSRIVGWVWRTNKHLGLESINIKKYLMLLLKGLRRPEVLVNVHTLNVRQRLSLYVYSLGRIFPWLYSELDREEIDYYVWNDKRAVISSMSWNNGFERIYCSILAEIIPAMYIEGYGGYIANVKVDSQLTSVRKIVSDVGWYYSDDFKLLCARSPGVCFVGVQHGGGYGIRLVNSSEFFEKRITDRYITWGWSEDFTDVPLSAPRLMCQCSNVSGNPGGVLLVTSALWKYPYFLDSVPTGGDHDRILERNMELYSRLVKDNEVVVRLHPQSKVWGEMGVWKDKFPSLILDGENKLCNSVSNYSLIIIDNMNTATLELLANNVPSILYWDRGEYPFRSSNEYIYHALLENKILIHDLNVLLEHVQKISNDIDGWWMSDGVQYARNLFVRKHARTSKNWCSEWLIELLADNE